MRFEQHVRGIDPPYLAPGLRQKNSRKHRLAGYAVETPVQNHDGAGDLAKPAPPIHAQCIRGARLNDPRRQSVTQLFKAHLEFGRAGGAQESCVDDQDGIRLNRVAA